MDLQLPKSGYPRVVIVGGGFGGIELAKRLKNKPFQVVMLDKHNYHTFQPLLYQVATGGLEADSIAFPLRKIFKGQKNLIFRVTKVTEINAAENCLHTDIGSIKYDYLVIATGSTSNFFGVVDLDAKAYFVQVGDTLIDMPTQPTDLGSLTVSNTFLRLDPDTSFGFVMQTITSNRTVRKFDKVN